jgi:hypothetical protein
MRTPLSILDLAPIVEGGVDRTGQHVGVEHDGRDALGPEELDVGLGGVDGREQREAPGADLLACPRDGAGVTDEHDLAAPRRELLGQRQAAHDMADTDGRPHVTADGNPGCQGAPRLSDRIRATVTILAPDDTSLSS